MVVDAAFEEGNCVERVEEVENAIGELHYGVEDDVEVFGGLDLGVFEPVVLPTNNRLRQPSKLPRLPNLSLKSHKYLTSKRFKRNRGFFIA